MTKDSPAPDNDLTPQWGLVAGLCSLLPFFLFAYFGDPGRGRAAAICFAVVIIAARVRWQLREHAWFWGTLIIVIILQIPLILLVPWTSKSYPGITLLPVAVVDYSIVCGCITLAGKMLNMR